MGESITNMVEVERVEIVERKEISAAGKTKKTKWNKPANTGEPDYKEQSLTAKPRDGHATITKSEETRKCSKNVETQTCANVSFSFLIPLLIPCQVLVRRMSYGEDYMCTLTGVKSLIEQQNTIVEHIKKLDK